MLTAKSFFELTDFADRIVFDNTLYVWEALANLKSYLNGDRPTLPAPAKVVGGIPLAEHMVLHDGILFAAGDCTIKYGDVGRGGLEVFRGGDLLAGASVIMAGAVLLGSRISIGCGVLVETGAMIKEPAIIGDYSEVRQGAYLRGYCLVGQRCVVGHATEVKSSIFLNDAKAGHFAYVGDSILGGGVNLGAGTKLANFRFLPGEVRIKTPEGYIGSGIRKLGAIMGDKVQTGCNTVTSPGTVIGPESMVMPNTTVSSGYYAPRSVLR